ncbi:hypothetical protein FGK63_02295 [Ruegeria sediminis]|uniref:Uncharacterized protein n=2 Tax=Ruegeria sediminis TaxID=2583820 RepID=A0ABY2X3F7_9RHOB|nr:hypothetical protein FGK63_02295 [Ruegeria sediminis]
MFQTALIFFVAPALAVAANLSFAQVAMAHDAGAGSVNVVDRIISPGVVAESSHERHKPRVNRYYIQPKPYHPRKTSRYPGSSGVEKYFDRPKRYHPRKRYYYHSSKPRYSPRSYRYPRYNYGSYPYPSQLRKPYRQRSSYRGYFRFGH